MSGQQDTGLRVDAVEVWTLTLDRLTPFSSANETIQRETLVLANTKTATVIGIRSRP